MVPTRSMSYINGRGTIFHKHMQNEGSTNIVRRCAPDTPPQQRRPSLAIAGTSSRGQGDPVGLLAAKTSAADLPPSDRVSACNFRIDRNHCKHHKHRINRSIHTSTEAISDTTSPLQHSSSVSERTSSSRTNSAGHARSNDRHPSAHVSHFVSISPK